MSKGLNIGSTIVLSSKRSFLRSPALFVSVAWLLSVTATGCFTQTKSSSIDAFIRALANRSQFSGSILVSEHGQAIYENGFGFADVKNKVPFTTTTPCYLASLSKQFTAMAVMILQEQGKISYADPLSKFFPEFPFYAQKVTIRNLLNHTSGISDYVGLGLEHPGLTNRDVFKALIALDSLEFTPGEKFQYSNSNYILLAMIIEKISGTSYREYLKQHIFDPLSMNNTFVRDESHPPASAAARAYNRFGDDADYDLLTYGEGGIYSSVHDMYKWDQSLYTEKLVKKSTLSEAFKRATLNDGTISGYGFGWALAKYDTETIMAHAGRYGGFNTYIKRFPDEQSAIIFLTNHDFKNMSPIGNALINILRDKPYGLPKLSVADMMFRTYKASDIASAIHQYLVLKANNDTTYDFSESELNELGYEFLAMKSYPEAIEILKLNVEEFPSSSNVYDGLGEAYMDHGERDLAIQNYRKSLELDSGNTNAVMRLKKLNAR